MEDCSTFKRKKGDFKTYSEWAEESKDGKINLTKEQKQIKRKC